MTDRDIIPPEKTILNVADKGLKSANVPNLRFSKFSEKWDYVLVSDLLETFSTNSLSWDMLDYDEGHIYNLHYGLIHSGLPTQIDCTEQKLPKIKPQYLPKNYTLCLDGDIAFADASEDTEEVGKVVEFFNSNKLPIVSGLHTIHCRDKENRTVIGYKGYAFSSVPFHHQVRRIAQGTKIYSINTKNFTELYVGIPSKAEQRKIADFLHLIDERIDTQSKIIEKYQSQMKSIIDGLVDYQAPQMRFEKLYSTAGEGGTPQTSKSEYYDNGTIPFIKIDDLTEKYLTNNKDFITEKGLKNSSAWIVPANSVIYSNGATVGRVSINTYPITTKQGILGIVPTNQVLTEYLYYFMRTTYFRKQVCRITVKGTMECAYLKDLNSIVCYIPSIEKQEKVLKLLHALDSRLELEVEVLKKLKEQKKYLLSNMFI